MDQPPKRSLADDPSFLASLSELERGLNDFNDAVQSSAARGNPRPALPAPTPAPPPPASAAPAPAPPTPIAVGPRPLLDLFPPESLVREAPPRIAASEPPRVAAAFRPRGVVSAPASALSHEFLYRSASHERVVQELVGAIGRRNGIVVLTGEAGVGKTTLCRALVEKLDRRTLVSLVQDPFVRVEDLLKTALVDFGVVSREDVVRGRLANASRHDLAATFRDFLGSLAAIQAFAVLIVDGAQTAPVDALDQLHLLLDFEGSQQLLQVVLVGEPDLTTLLGRAELRSLDARVTRRCELEPLNRDETAAYMTHRLAVAGSQASVEFDDGAMTRVYEVTRGVPRDINLLCDHALTLASDKSAATVDRAMIDSAAKELDLAVPQVRTRWTERVLLAVVLVALMLVGAAAAAWVFRGSFSRAVSQWRSAPASPGEPARSQPAPAAPTFPP